MAKNKGKQKQNKEIKTENKEEIKIKSDPSAKCWTCTMNNPTMTDEEFFTFLQNIDDVKYFCFRREKAPSTGTIHFQFYVVFKIKKHFSTVQKYLPKCHLIISNGSKAENRAYCQKLESAVGKFYEDGDFGAEERTRTDIHNILALIYGGTPLDEIRQLYPTQFFMYQKRFVEARRQYLKEKFGKSFRELDVIYIHGETGVGKSRCVYKKYGFENVFAVTNYGRFAFDGYEGQDVILLEEYRENFNIGFLLKVLDGYPLRLEVKGGYEQACYTKVYITSNWKFNQQHAELYNHYDLAKRDLATYKAFTRRVNKIYNFDNQVHREAFAVGELPNPEQLEMITDKKELENLPF